MSQPPRYPVPDDLERERLLDELRQHRPPRPAGVFGPAEPWDDDELDQPQEDDEWR